MEDLIKKMMEANTLSEHEAVSKACTDYLATATDDERRDIKEAIKKKANSIISDSSETRKKALEFIAKIKMRIFP
ncbi:hypothetical protein [Dyadobacter sp. NIV53]|uniref:hypothetical protein n=1 Tax=Dyadobacter sp. NIV53 TaxID=2861765 RepID=UPI001C8806F0|nr:hypothetical protein [Dyadobacter sp. NIV53]